MTATISLPRPKRGASTAVVAPPLSPGFQVVRAVLLTVFALALSLLFEMLIVSSAQQRASQQKAFDALRSDLANGTAPLGPTNGDGAVLALGTPLAYLEIPAIDLRQVVVEGTTPSALFAGPGHRRDTPLPGQAGTSVVLGRRAAFGGPFARLDQLRKGATIRITTGQGVFEYRVTGTREDGDPAPAAPRSDEGRLLLATAAGRPFMPSGTLRVDAELSAPALAPPDSLLDTKALPASEQIMGVDTSTLWALALWLQALTVLSVGAVWAWGRWGRAQAWVVFVPPVLFAGLGVSGEAARLLPNLL